MEAVPRLPMISFELKVSPENVQFGPQLKQYIANFYNEDPESYNAEISNLEALRAAAIRPTTDVAGCQLLKKYYCQLHFLKSRFPMAELQAAAVYFSWKDSYSNMPCKVPDIRFELMCILYNIGALHTQLGASDSRTSADGLKMSCTHFQCAAWAFQTIKETYYQIVPYVSSIEVIHFMQQVCFAQAQECILEKSMMDNRKATITAKVAVQVVDHYKRALSLLTFGDEESSFSNFVGSRTTKEWSKYLSFKVSYHKCIALLFQGQQAEEQQKMGERVAFYQAACEQLDEARKLSSTLKQQKEINEAIAFTSDVVEGKRKAAKNENEFIYHEEVPEIHTLQEVKGASLVKGIAFNINDVEVSGPDIFARLVPMEAHEASSLYSEKKAQKLRQLGELVESKDQALAEFMSSLQLDVFNHMHQATGLSQDLVDRAAALSAKPTATQDLVSAMSKLSDVYHEVESMLNEIQELLTEEEQNEKEYQELMGKRPPSIIATDLAREAAKYKEAHNKANDSNQNLHKAMITHVANLKILAQPLTELQQQIPVVEFPNSNIDENCVKEIENLMGKVEEMRNQRAMLWSQFRESIHKDDITNVLVTRQPDQPLDQLFQNELQKHQELSNLIEQNISAQENILKAFVDAYARSTSTRRYLQDIINKRNATVTALITSYDTYEDLLAKANKGIDFYNKLETNVAKLLQRIKSASKVQQEEREQMLLKNSVSVSSEEISSSSMHTVPKLKDYIDIRKKPSRSYAEVTPQCYGNLSDAQIWPPAIRPAPLGSEVTSDSVINKPKDPSVKLEYETTGYSIYEQNQHYDNLDQQLANRFSTLRTATKPDAYYSQYTQYTPENYIVPNYTYSPPSLNLTQVGNTDLAVNKQAFTVTTDTYQPISSIGQNAPNAIFNVSDHDAVNTYSYTQPQYSGEALNFNVPSSTNLDNDYTQIYQSRQLHQPHQINQQNIYYPTGYGAIPTQVTTEQTYSYPPVFGSTEYATSVHPSVSNISYNTTYSAPTVDMKSTSFGNNGFTISHGESYQTYSSLQQFQNNFYGENYMQNQTYPVNYINEYSHVQHKEVVPVTTKESNIDLLTGLDFTVSQVPLIPQQNPVSELKPAHKTELPRPSKFTDVNETEPPKVDKVINRKPLNNYEVKALFDQEIEKYEKFVDVLASKTLNGPTNLDLRWKEIQEKQEGDKKAISVARCYPTKNRYPDILPYDHSRVELKGTKDDYINASHIKDISYYAAPFIVTQLPLQSTIGDFWTMIKEQQVEIIVCLLGDAEINNDIYWPTEKGKDLCVGELVVSLVNVTAKPHWIERLISVCVPEKRDSRTIMHLQFSSWPGSLFPPNPEGFICYIIEVINVYLQQRSTAHPVVVHCSSGMGRSGLTCLLIAAILEVNSNPVMIPDLVSLTIKLASLRKNILRDRAHLKFAYEAFLTYMKHVIAQGRTKTILNNVVQTGENDKNSVPVENQREPNDPLNNLDPFWASKKDTI